MLYLTLDELPFYTPQVTLPTKIPAKMGYIYMASKMIDAACGRSELGLQMRDIIKPQIYLDLNITGLLPVHPFVRWIDTIATVFIPGTGARQNLTLTDFDIEYQPGIIKYKKLLTGGSWPRSQEPTTGPWADTIGPYHSGSPYLIDDNSLPYMMQASYRAGFFTEVDILATGNIGDTSISVSSANDIFVGQEFSFSQDITNEVTTDIRIVTAVATGVSSGSISFSPALAYTLMPPAKLRRIDRAVREAVGLIISSLITFPPDTYRYDKGLGRNSILKRYEKNVKRPIPPSAMELLGRYME
jgi:hypothetical protein